MGAGEQRLGPAAYKRNKNRAGLPDDDIINAAIGEYESFGREVVGTSAVRSTRGRLTE